MSGTKAGTYSTDREALERQERNQIKAETKRTIKEIETIAKNFASNIRNEKLQNSLSHELLALFSKEIKQQKQQASQIATTIEKTDNLVQLRSLQSELNKIRTNLKNNYNHILSEIKTLDRKLSNLSQKMTQIEEQMKTHRDALVKWFPKEQLEMIRKEFVESKKQLKNLKISDSIHSALKKAQGTIEKIEQKTNQISDQFQPILLKAQNFDQQQMELARELEKVKQQFEIFYTQPGALSSFPEFYNETIRQLAELEKRLQNKDLTIGKMISEIREKLNKIEEHYKKIEELNKIKEEIKEKLNQFDLVQQDSALIQKWFPKEFEEITTQLEQIENEINEKEINEHTLRTIQENLEKMDHHISKLHQEAQEKEKKLMERIDVVKALHEAASELGFQLLDDPEYENENDKSSPIKLLFATQEGDKIEYKITSENQIISESLIPKNACDLHHKYISEGLKQRGILVEFTVVEKDTPLDVLKTAKGTSHSKQKTTIKRTRKR